ncbi:mechanosensitive ion channel protein 1, mitochondrial-like [Neltuma alba]|uniref:mechanosensitive ion channel protein 1, mitochondrial-like n=1 Tax=Neltuma alba TaxID=207710 RepID=UPI0010A4F787|nr:mechanosensitive ion channel protein 1, mitochondrial-like [Prosopis alba]
MAGVRFSCLKRLQKFSAKCSLNLESVQPNHHIMNLARCEDCVHVNFPTNSVNQAYFKGELRLPVNFAKNQFRIMTSENSNLLNTKPSAPLSPNFSSFSLQNSLPFASVNLLLNHRSYSSSLSGEGSRDGRTDSPYDYGASDSTDISHWAHDLTPCVQQLFDSHPFLNDVVIPVGVTLTATLIAWTLMPLILRKFHEKAMQSSATILLSEERLPYEKSIWGALEDPLRYMITFVAFSQISLIVAPTSEASHHLAEAWKEAVIFLFTWFLHRWKTSILGHISSRQSLVGHGQHKLLTLHRVSSAGIFGIGTMALAEACGISVQSIVIVGGIGGFATAFAGRDVLANVFSGLSMQSSEPFTIGDTIKAGWVEGEVIEIGLTETLLVNAEKMAVMVPNSYFCRQVIVIKSRAECRGMISKIPLKIEAIQRIPKISDEIKNMLRTNGKVLLGKGAPYCYLSRIETSYAELTLGYNLKHMGKDEMSYAEQEVVEEAVEILKRHRADLGLLSHLSSSSSDSD